MIDFMLVSEQQCCAILKDKDMTVLNSAGALNQNIVNVILQVIFVFRRPSATSELFVVPEFIGV